MSTRRTAELIHGVVVDLALYLEGRVVAPWISLSPEDRSMYQDAVKWIRSTANLTPAKVHDFWMDRMKESGWTFGPTKNYVEKTHPCVAPYERLSEYEKSKDILFMSLARRVVDK